MSPQDHPGARWHPRLLPRRNAGRGSSVTGGYSRRKSISITIRTMIGARTRFISQAEKSKDMGMAETSFSKTDLTYAITRDTSVMG